MGGGGVRIPRRAEPSKTEPDCFRFGWAGRGAGPKRLRMLGSGVWPCPLGEVERCQSGMTIMITFQICGVSARWKAGFFFFRFPTGANSKVMNATSPISLVERNDPKRKKSYVCVGWGRMV